MMVLSLLFGKKYPSPKVGSIDLDVTIREEHRFASRVTNYPVEDGTIISDHIINEPDIVILVGLVTDTPLSIFAPFNRSIDAFNRLIQLHQNRDVVTVVTGLKVYKNMAITTLDVPRDIRTGQSLTFTIELQRIVFDTSVRLLLDQGNIFGGIQTKIPRDTVASNANYPIIQNDPADSLKDQASSGINVGVQSLAPIPGNILPAVLSVKRQILGVA
jgi:hypothetical protein